MTVGLKFPEQKFSLRLVFGPESAPRNPGWRKFVFLVKSLRISIAFRVTWFNKLSDE
jgi:hypothetical protein